MCSPFHTWLLSFSLLSASKDDYWGEAHLDSSASLAHTSGAPSALVCAQHPSEWLGTLFGVDLPHHLGITASRKSHPSTWIEFARFVSALAILIDSAT